MKDEIMPHLLSVDGRTPDLGIGVFLADSATVAGWVLLADHTSVWFGAVLRAEHSPIQIGIESNVQDLCCIHSDPEHPVTLGDRVTVGHRAVLHGCAVDSDALIGMGAIVLNGATIGEGAIVAAGALVAEGFHVPPFSLAVGIPAKPVRSVDRDIPRPNVAGYRELADHYRAATDGQTVGNLREQGCG